MRSSKGVVAALALVLPLISACTTTLETDAVKPEVAQAPAVGKFTYVLPKTSFVVTGTLTLNACGAVDVDGAHHYRPSLDITEVFAVAPVVEADPDAQYAIPYDKLRTWMKEINVTVTSNSNKTFGGVNATINDQSGPVVLAAVLAGVKIAGGLSIPAVAHAQVFDQHLLLQDVPPAAPKPPAYCTDGVLRALQQIDADNASISTQTGHDTAAKVTVPNPSIAKWQSEIAQLRRDFALARTFSFYWSPTFSTASSSVEGTSLVFVHDLDLYTKLIHPWLSDAGSAWYDDAANSGAEGFHAVHDPIEVRLTLRQWSTGVTTTDATTHVVKPVVPDATGLVLRDPALGELRLCRNACSAETDIAETTGDLAPPATVNVPQFGRYVVLPLNNGVFENSNLVVTLNADGSIASLGNHSTGTLAAGLGVAGQVGDQFATSTTARNTAITAANTAANANAAAADTANKTLADCLSQQDAVRKAGGTPIGSCQ